MIKVLPNLHRSVPVRLWHGTLVAVKWQLFISSRLANRQVVEVISTRERLWVARYGAVFLVVAFHLGRNRQVARISQ